MCAGFEDADRELFETPGEQTLRFQGVVVDVLHMPVKLPNGKTALREIVRHPGAAAVVPVDDDGFVTLVRQHRVVVGRMTWEIPAGKFDRPGEDPLACAKRELSEETGQTADHWEALLPMDTSPGFCTERVHLFLATGLHAGETHTDADEFLHVKRVPLSEAAAAVMRGELSDGKTALGILMAYHLLKGRGALPASQ